MLRPLHVLSVAGLTLLLLGCQSQAALPPSPGPTVDPSAAAAELRQVETDRVAALVAGDADAARPFHALQYWLVDPTGGIWARDDYLNAIGSGALDYVSWTAKSDMAVRIVGDAGIVRYRASIEVSGGTDVISGDFWHTDYYERIDGRWQAVWSQATQITDGA